MLGSRGGANAPTTLTANKSTPRVKGKVAPKQARMFPPRAAVLAEITDGLGATSKFSKVFDSGGGKEPGRSGVFDDARYPFIVTDLREAHGNLRRSIPMFDFVLALVVGVRPWSARGGGEKHPSDTARRNPTLDTSNDLGIEQIKLRTVQDFNA